MPKTCLPSAEADRLISGPMFPFSFSMPTSGRTAFKTASALMNSRENRRTGPASSSGDSSASRVARIMRSFEAVSMTTTCLDCGNSNGVLSVTRPRISANASCGSALAIVKTHLTTSWSPRRSSSVRSAYSANRSNRRSRRPSSRPMTERSTPTCQTAQLGSSGRL